MNILISNSSDKPIYEQITSQVKSLIMQGKLQKGDLLPSIRMLAKELRISVITTKRAYEELEQAGFISTVVGKGSFVREANREIVQEEHLKEIEELLSRAVSVAQQCGIKKSVIYEIMDVIYQEENQ